MKKNLNHFSHDFFRPALYSTGGHITVYGLAKKNCTKKNQRGFFCGTLLLGAKCFILQLIFRENK